MNILIISQYFYPENFRINDLAEALLERGHQVTVLTGYPNYPSGRVYEGYGLFRAPQKNWRGIEIVRAPLIARGRGGGIRLALNYLSFALAASLISVLRLSRKFDVIFVHEPSPITVGIPAIVMKKITGAPILFWVLDLWPESVAAASNVRSPWVIRQLSRLTCWIYRHCDRVLVQSREFIPHTRKMGVDDARIRYFPSWAERLYGPVELPPPVPLPVGFRIMFAGNVGVAQDFPAILSAAERIRHREDIHWVIIGDGRLSAWLQEEVVQRRLHKTVHLLGRYPLETMPAFFAHADALLVSLKAEKIFAQTIPGKLQSYLACGRPILAMLDGEGAKIIEEAGAGLVCPAGNADVLAAKVLQLADMEAVHRSDMGRRGYAYFLAEFERDMLVSRLEKWMAELVLP